MMRWSAARFVWAVMGLWLAACGVVPPENFLTDYLDATCAWEARCGVIRDEAACVRASRDMPRISPLTGYWTTPFVWSAELVAAGRVRFDAARAGQCLERLRELSCDSGETPSAIAYDCDPYVGERRAGEACLLDAECVADFYCDRRESGKDVCAPGFCAPRLGAGERPERGQACARGLTWDADGVCHSPSEEGGPCSVSSPFLVCAAGLFCDAGTLTCRARGRDGEACSRETQCMTYLNCGDDGRCHPLADLGEACTHWIVLVPRDDPRPVTLACKTDLLCVGGTPTTRGTCGTLLSEGADCSAPWECQSPWICAGPLDGPRTCRAPAEIGASCEDLSCVAAAYCDPHTKTCAARGQKRGDACDVSARDSCVLGFFCEEGRCAPSFGGTCEE